MTFYSPFLTNKSFDRVAWCYDTLARLVFGRAQLRAQAHFLSLIPDFSQVLLIGGGSGWLLEQLLLQKPKVQVLYLEASSNMIRLAQKRTSKLDTSLVEWCCGTEQSLVGSNRFDVLLTPFILDLFTQQELLHQFLPRLVERLDEGGIWLFTDFVAPTSWWQKALERGMYWFFRPLTHIRASQLPEFNLCFEHFNFQIQASKFFYWGFIESKTLTRKSYKSDIMS